MKQVKIIQNPTSLSTPIKAVWCASFLCKLRGLTFRKHLPKDQGLLLVGSQDSRVDAGIHMLFVWFDLGIIWINDAGKIVDAKLAKSWVSVLLPAEPARYVLEVHPDRLLEFNIGDQIVFEETTLD